MPTMSVAGASPPEVSAAGAPVKAKPTSTLKSAKKSVTEGDVLKLTASVGQSKSAKRVTLQRWEKPYTWASGQWVPVKSAKPKRTVTFRTTVTSLNSAKYRVSVTYKERARPVVSKAASVTVWRWEPLRSFRPYYSTSSTGFGTAQINGWSHPGWGPFTYSHLEAWESRFTLGRHCTHLRGIAALTDLSDDGALGSLAITADGVPVWSAQELAPGRSARFEVKFIGKPYRIAASARNDSADPSKTDGWPVIGDPEVYCTGI